jgi:hypothetical protein
MGHSLPQRSRESIDIANGKRAKVLSHLNHSPYCPLSCNAWGSFCFQNENAALIQKFWFRKKEKRLECWLHSMHCGPAVQTVICVRRVARQIVVTMLRKRFAKENKRIGNLVGDLGTTLAVNEPLKVGDKYVRATGPGVPRVVDWR